MDRKEQIILSTLKLASNKGLGNVSLQMIADDIGIRKASLFNHFKSKDELIKEMYLYLREKAKVKSSLPSIDFSASASEIIYNCYLNYFKLCTQTELISFYKLIYSERCFSSQAASIMIEETEKMQNAVYQLLNTLVKLNKLKINDIKSVSDGLSFSLHGFLEYEMDTQFINQASKCSVENYIKSFCEVFGG